MKKNDVALKTVLVVVIGVTFFWSWLNFDAECKNIPDLTECLYTHKYALIDPIFYGTKWLLIILIAMVCVPWRTYKPWVLTVLPISLAISLLLISNISVYSSGVMSISRAQMAVNCAVVLAVLSIVFVLASEWYQRRKERAGV